MSARDHEQTSLLSAAAASPSQSAARQQHLAAPGAATASVGRSSAADVNDSFFLHRSYGGDPLAAGAGAGRRTLGNTIVEFATRIRRLDADQRSQLARACRTIAEDEGCSTRNSSFFWFPQATASFAASGADAGGGGGGAAALRRSRNRRPRTHLQRASAAVAGGGSAAFAVEMERSTTTGTATAAGGRRGQGAAVTAAADDDDDDEENGGGAAAGPLTRKEAKAADEQDVSDVLAGVAPRNFGVAFAGPAHFFLFRAGTPLYVHLPTAATALLTVALLWVALWTAFGQAFEPHGAIFDAFFTVFFSGIVGGLGCWMLQLPPLVGIMWAAVAYAHLPWGLTSGITTTVTSPFKTLGLTIILLRGGLSLNLRTMRPIALNVFLLGVLPMATEAVVTGFLASRFFHYDSTRWALLHGFTTAPLSSSVVVSSCLFVQSQGFGSTGGPPMLMLSSVGLDSSLGIWASTFLQSLVLSSRLDPTVAAISAVAQVVGGVALGVAAGAVVARATQAFGGARNAAVEDPDAFALAANRRAFWLIVLTAGALLFLSKRYELEGGGALSVVCFGATLNHFWIGGGSGDAAAEDPKPAAAAAAVARKRYFTASIATLWDTVGMPAIFAFVGAKMDIAAVFSGEFLRDALVIWAAGSSARLLLALLATWGTDFSGRERAVLALGWVGKATAQATLGSMVLDHAMQLLDSATTADEVARYTEWVRRGHCIANMSVLAIVLGAPLASLAIRQLGVRWVRLDPDALEHLHTVGASRHFVDAEGKERSSGGGGGDDADGGGGASPAR